MNFQKQGSDPGEQKRLILAVALSAAVLLLWQLLVPRQPPVAPAEAPGSVASGAPGSAAPGSVAAGSPGSAGAAAPASVAIERRIIAKLASEGRQTVALTNDDGQLATWDLEEAQYRDPGETKDKTVAHRMMRTLDANEASKGFFLPPRLELELAGRPIRGDYTLVEQADRKVTLAYTDASGVKITRIWELAADDYTIAMRLVLENLGGASVPYALSASVPGVQNDSEAGGSMFSPPVYAFKALCQHPEDFEHQAVSEVLSNQADPDEPKAWASATWAGVDNRYFMSAVLPKAGEAETCSFAAGSAVPNAPTLPAGYSLVVAGLKFKGGEIPAGGRVERAVTFYVGPKKLDALKAQTPSLEETVDLGWFPIIGLPMLWLMQVFYGFIANWGLAIILLTIVVKLLTLPLTHKQYKSMAAMKKLQPELKALQTKYAEDKPRLQQEMMKLYKENKVNPLAGCLPMLLMMPIYVSLYQTIYSAVELYRADFVFWIKDLSERDPYFVWPALLGILFFVQMRLNPSMSDNPQQKIIMNIMPIMFTAMMLFLPSGLVIYIFVNTVLGLVQQLVLYKKEAEQQPTPPPAGAARRRAA